MRKSSLIIGRTMFFALLMVFVLISGCTNNASNSLNENKNNNYNSIETSAFKTISIGSLDSGDATVDLTPRGMENSKFAVDISVNTHSIDLSQFDLMQIATLEYDGKTVKPLSAPELSGHHSSGALSFDTRKEINDFKIIIRGIPAVEERVFEWP